MKTGKVAKAFGVDPKTISNWTDNPLFRDFFSSAALGEADHSQREFNESDLVVLNTIRAERSRNTDWEEIGKLLTSNFRETELPPSAMLVESMAPIAQYGRIVTLIAERDAAKAEIERVSQESQRKDEAIEKLQQEVRNLNRQIGRLEGRIDYLEDDLNKRP